MVAIGTDGALQGANVTDAWQSQGYHQLAANTVWPVVHNDISYLTEYWNQSGFGEFRSD